MEAYPGYTQPTDQQIKASVFLRYGVCCSDCTHRDKLRDNGSGYQTCPLMYLGDCPASPDWTSKPLTFELDSEAYDLNIKNVVAVAVLFDDSLRDLKNGNGTFQNGDLTMSNPITEKDGRMTLAATFRGIVNTPGAKVIACLPDTLAFKVEVPGDKYPWLVILSAPWRI